MHVLRIQLKNVRCFEDLCLEFGPSGSSMLILADNGQGKSTLLRSLAMGLCDESSAAALFRELPGEFVRRPKDTPHVPTGNWGEICVDFAHEQDDDPEQLDYYRIRTKIVAGDLFERINQDEHPTPDADGLAGLYELNSSSADAAEKWSANADFPWSKFFVSGYGAGSRTRGTADYRYYLPVDAVYPIFNYSNPLQNPELAMRRLVDAAHKVATAKATQDAPGSTKELHEAYESAILNKVKKPLQTVLDLDDIGQIDIQSNAILVRGAWGTAELGELGDGYRSTITWILDLFSWWFLYYFAPATHRDEFDAMVIAHWDEFMDEELSGIVIIDEIDQHLHPKWQHSILPNLTRAFPQVQFIATTHSPMTVLGTTEVEPSHRLKLCRLSEQGGAVAADYLDPPTHLRADQVLTHPYFGLLTASDNRLKGDIAEFSILSSKTDLSANEKTKLEALRADLNAALGSEESELEREVRSALKQTLNSRLNSNPAVHFEIQRQLNALFKEGEQ